MSEESLKAALLSDVVVCLAWEEVLEGVDPEDVLPELRGQARTREIIEAALRLASSPIESHARF